MSFDDPHKQIFNDGRAGLLMVIWTPKSRVAGIVEVSGGVRIVVTERWRMKLHVMPGERLFIVPGLCVHEPVPFNQIPGLIEKVTAYVQNKIGTSL